MRMVIIMHDTCHWRMGDEIQVGEDFYKVTFIGDGTGETVICLEHVRGFWEAGEYAVKGESNV